MTDYIRVDIGSGDGALLRNLVRASAKGMRSLGKGMRSIKQLATFWLESERVIRHVLCANKSEKNALYVDKIMNTGHRRKILLRCGDVKYIYQVALKKEYIQALGEMHRLARAHSVPVAPVLSIGTSWKNVIPVHYIVLGWMAGTPCNKDVSLNFQQLNELGRIFGRLHSIGPDQWNLEGAGYPRRFENADEMLSDLRSMVIGLSALEGERADDVVNIFQEWVSRCDSTLRQVFELRLIHGDAHGNNILIDESGLSLIDTDQMRFDLAFIELFRCLLANYNGFDIERQLMFLAGYRQSVDSRVWSRWEDNLVVISAIGFLLLANQKLVHGSRMAGGERGVGSYVRAISFWKAFLKLVSNQSVCDNNLRSIMSLYHDVYNQISQHMDVSIK